MLNLSFLLETAPEGGTVDTSWIWIVMIVAMVAMFFFMHRSQKKRERQEAAERDALQVGDEITTIGGIIGKVISIKEDTFVLETTKDRTKIRFLKGAIRSVDVKIAEVTAQKTAEVNAMAGVPEKAEAPKVEAKPEAEAKDDAEKKD